MAGENVLTLTDANFQQQVLDNSEPVLVDFWAEWCGPCRMLAPTIEKLATEYQGKVKVGKVDTDANRNTAMKFNISAIPTVILLTDPLARYARRSRLAVGQNSCAIKCEFILSRSLIGARLRLLIRHYFERVQTDVPCKFLSKSS